MAYAIKKGSDYFKAVTYTGTGASQDVDVGFSPDFTWIKNRSHDGSDPYYGVHLLYDTIRGVGNRIMSSSTAIEAYSGGALTSFNSDGFSVGTDNSVSYSGDSFISWNWKAGESTVENTDGSITSQVSANPTSKFSVVTYTGNGSGSATIGHGLGTTPAMIIARSRSSTQNWRVYHSSFGTTTSNTLYLDLNNATSTTDSERISAVASDTFTVTQTSGGALNASGQNYVAYCFAEVAGYSKFGTYTGNSNADGPFVYTGFRPQFFMMKPTNTANSWIFLDTARDGEFNTIDLRLLANTNDLENSSPTGYVDFYSNGFKLRYNGAYNNSSYSYIYMAFGSTPFKYANAL